MGWREYKPDPRITLLHTHGLDISDPMVEEGLMAMGRFTHRIDDERCPGETCPFHARQWRKRARRARRVQSMRAGAPSDPSDRGM